MKKSFKDVLASLEEPVIDNTEPVSTQPIRCGYHVKEFISLLRF